MRAVELVFAVAWAAFWLYWLLAAFSMKKGRAPWSRELGIRAGIVVVVILLIRLGAFRNHGLNTDPWRAGLGLVLLALGLGFAIWARVHIGRLWSGSVALKAEHALIRGGPYAITRHPIYSGLPLALLGTAIARDTQAALLGLPLLFAGLFLARSAANNAARTAPTIIGSAGRLTFKLRASLRSLSPDRPTLLPMPPEIANLSAMPTFLNRVMARLAIDSCSPFRMSSLCLPSLRIVTAAARPKAAQVELNATSFALFSNSVSIPARGS